MKIRLAATGVAVIVAAISCLLGGSTSASNEPLPGIYIVVNKNPGGEAVQAKTDKNGKFVFANLEAGTYLLSVKMPQTKSGMNNIAGSNTWSSNRSMQNGVEVVDVSLALGKDQPAPVEIEITKNGGKIIGTVTRAENAGDVKRSTAASLPNGGDVKPGIAGDPIPGVPIGLEGDPGSVIVMSNPPKEGSPILYKGFKGIVTSVKGVATIKWEDGFVTRIVSPSQNGAAGKLRFEVVGSHLKLYGAPQKGGDVKPGIAGVPIQGIPVGLEGDPGSVIVMSNPPKEGSPILYRGFKGIVTLVERVRSINWGDGFVTRIVDPSESAGKGKLRFEVVGSQLKLYGAPQNGGDVKPGIAGVPIQGTAIGLEGDPGSVIVMSNPPKEGNPILYKGSKGIVTLVRQVATIKWENGFVTRIVDTSQQNGKAGISDQGTIGGLIAYRTASPKKDSNGILTYELVKIPDSKSRAPK